MQLNELLRTASHQLQEAGYLHGQREAEIILGHLTGLDTAKLFTSGEEEIDESIVRQTTKAVEERIKGRPLAYIVGTQQFLGFQLKSDERALIPRPETEQLVEHLVKRIRDRHLQSGEILEVGTGAGPIAISLKKYFPASRVTATDVSAEALELAEDNAQSLGVDIHFLESDLLSSVPVKPYDVIVANLPYVPEERLAFVSDEILDWEPMVAVQASEDGYDYIRRFLDSITPYTHEGTIIALEMWHTHAPLVEQQISTLFPGATIEIRQDLAGFDRFALIER
jgi:release factor glutamine methyltransferase